MANHRSFHSSKFAFLLGARLAPLLDDFFAVDNRQHLGRLLAAHDGGARIGPGKNKVRPKASPRHAVITCAEGCAYHHRDAGHPHIGHRLNHFAAVLDDATLLALGTHHEAGCVHQKYQRNIPLVAQLHELRGFGRALGCDGAVVANNAHRHAVDMGPATNRVAVVFGLEIQKLATVHNAGNHLAAIIGLAVVQRHHAAQLPGAVKRWPHRCLGQRRAMFVPVQAGQNLAR